MKEKMTLSHKRERVKQELERVHLQSFGSLGPCAGQPLEDGRAGATCLADLESESFCCLPLPLWKASQFS